MAEKYAVANGNWSNPATWNGGTLPGNADDVYANRKTVTIDIDLVGSYSVKSIRTTAGSTAAAGGTFRITASRTIEFVAGGSGIVAGTTTCVQLNHTTPAEVVIRWATGGSGVIVTGGSMDYAYGINNNSTGSVTVTGDVTGGSSYDTYGILNASTGSVTVTGNVTGSSSGSGAYGINNNSTGSVTVTGDVTGGSSWDTYGILNASTGSVTVTGNVTGGSSNSAYGINNYSTGSVTVTGDVMGGSGTYAYGINNNSSGIVTINGDCYAGKAPALYNVANGVIDVYGSLNPSPTRNTDVAINANAISGKIIFSTLKADTTNHRWPGVIGRCFVRDTNSYLQIYDKDEQQVTYIDNSGVPAESDVRYGVTYMAGGVRTGTCHVPAPDSVAYGVPVDNTVGTAVLRMSDVANAVWNEPRSAHTTPGTFGAVSEWAGGDSGGSDWTDDEKKQIRYRLGIDGTTQAPSTNTPHLGSSYSTLDDLATHVSTRLAASDYVAPDNASIASIKSKTDAYLDATVSSRLAASDYVAPDNTSISAIKSRTDAYLDTAVSSRLASSAYVAPDNASITAIKAKTDNLTFNEDNYVYAVGVGEGGGTDWTDAEKQQIRYRLGIDGTTETPSTNTPHLGSSYSTLDDLAAHVSTRLAASAYTPPDNASITAIKTKTDQLSFDSGKVAAKISDPVSLSSTDVSAIVDGVWDEPAAQHTQTGSTGALLGVAGSGSVDYNTMAQAVWQYTTRELTGFNFQVTVASNLDKNGYALTSAYDRAKDALKYTEYTAPDNNSITAIKNQTDKLLFSQNGSENYVVAILTLSCAQSVAGIVWSYETRSLTSNVTVGGYAQGVSPANEMEALGYTTDRATKLDNLDAAISTRLASSSYTTPDNASIAAIKEKTDQLSFDSGKVLAKVSDPVTISSTDVNAIVDGVWDEPISQHTTSGSAGAVLELAGSSSVDYNTIAQTVWQHTTRELTGFNFQVTVGTNLDKTNYTLTSAYDRAKDALKYTEYTPPDNTDIIAILNQVNRIQFTPENYIRSAIANPETIAQTIFTYDITKAENLAPAYSLTTLILGSLYMVTSNNTMTIYKSNGLPHLTRNLGIDPLDGHISAIRP